MWPEKVEMRASTVERYASDLAPMQGSNALPHFKLYPTGRAVLFQQSACRSRTLWPSQTAHNSATLTA